MDQEHKPLDRKRPAREQTQNQHSKRYKSMYYDMPPLECEQCCLLNPPNNHVCVYGSPVNWKKHSE